MSDNVPETPTGVASEDRCPTCKWGRLKPCPDEWHTECDARVAEAEKEIERLKKWVGDLQDDCFINCVYCGHRYDPDYEVPASMADVLKAHIEQCPEHPMSKLKAESDDRVAKAVRDQMEADCKAMCLDCNDGKPVELRRGEWRHEWEPGIPKYFQVCNANAIRAQADIEKEKP